MAHIVGEVTIGAPVDEVFDIVADERNEPRYNPRIVRAEKVSEGPVGRGARFVAEPKSMGAKGQMTLEILEYDRPHRLHNLVRSSYMQVDGTLTFEEVDGCDAAEVGLGHEPGRIYAGAVSGAGRHRTRLGAPELGWPKGVHGIRPPLSLGFEVTTGRRVVRRTARVWRSSSSIAAIVVAIGGMMPSLSSIAATLVTNDLRLEER